MLTARYQWVDALRGFAMVWMTGFHFCFDLANAGLLQANFYQDPVWLQIAGCALLVTISSYIMFPRSFIYFGVLQGMAVMLLISRIVGPRGRWLWAAGLLLIALNWIAPWAITEGWWDSALNDKPLNWLGLISIKPITEDYVPLVPWLGVMLWGIAAMQWVLNRHAAHALHQADIPALRPLAFLGRWSLSYYMLHQPVMLGALWLWQRV